MIRFFLALLIGFIIAVPAHAQMPLSPQRLIKAQFSSNTNMFTTTDPNAGGLTLTSATGKDRGYGSVQVGLTTGFTAPVTLTAFYWNNRAQKWIHVDARAGTATNIGYSVSMDTNYATWIFPIPYSASFIIMSSGAVTGPVYTDSIADPNNNNTLAN